VPNAREFLRFISLRRFRHRDRDTAEQDLPLQLTQVLLVGTAFWVALAAEDPRPNYLILPLELLVAELAVVDGPELPRDPDSRRGQVGDLSALHRFPCRPLDGLL
jgi:hypothetical protein